MLSGTPTQDGSYTVSFTASNGIGANAVQSFTLTVDAAPTITSADSTTFAEGSEGKFSVTAYGNPAPSISESGALPTGVEFKNGTMSGTPTEEGVYPISFTAANGVGVNASQNFTLTVDSSPAITSASSATFSEGSAGSFTVTATGTPQPTITEHGALPDGLELKDGVLSGTPTQEGIYALSLTARNEAGFSTQSFTLTVDAAPTITSSDGAAFTKGVEDSFMVTATGTPQPTITESGALPGGVKFNGGVLSGTPTQIGSFEVTFTAHNGIGADSVQRFTLTVLGLHVTTTSLPTMTRGSFYSVQLDAAGGSTPYKWKVTKGKLPGGLKLSPAGLLSGTLKRKADPGDQPVSFSVTVTSHGKTSRQTATATFTLDVS